ncbi:MAG: hypothetical protein NVSMB3_02070 [Acidobacteriaceae bacterium]
MQAIEATEKRLDAMNRLGDMLHFPAAVNAGATANVMATIALTWWIEPRYAQPYAVLVWIALVLALNLLPVLVLRRTMRPDEPMRRLGEMDFLRDQHRFSDWVYLAASANMAFWILLAWSTFAVRRSGSSLAVLEAVAFLATFSPVLLRPMLRGR